MCGRYTLSATPEEIAAEMAIKIVRFTPAPRYNVAPTQTIAVVALQDGERALDGFRWGLIPSWAKDAGIGAKGLMPGTINS